MGKNADKMREYLKANEKFMASADQSAEKLQVATRQFIKEMEELNRDLLMLLEKVEKVERDGGNGR